ncbi:MAG: hypothetical protein Alis3KO_17740 [Aliiglaciecola sp.]
MKIQRNQKCPCGSGKKYKKCCLDLDKDFEKSDQTATCGSGKNLQPTIYHGFTEEFAHLNFLNVDYEKACCQIIQANQSIAEEQNALLKFEMLEAGDWFVMAKANGQVKVSFKYKTIEAAMDIAKEKFGAIKFFSQPEFI